MSTLYESYTTGDNTVAGAYGNNWIAQGILTDTGFTATSVKLKIYRTGSPGTVTVSIRATYLYASSVYLPTGGDLAVGTINGDSLDESSPAGTFPGNGTEITFTTPYYLSANTAYAIVIRCAGADTNNKVNIRYDSAGATYPTGGTTGLYTYCSSTNAGSSWGYTPGADVIFALYGESIPYSDSIATKQLVCCSKDEVWYESVAGTMTQLAASVGALNTSRYLDMFELDGKAFIVNESIKKVVDFRNTKLSTATIGTVPTRGMTLTGGTSTATMIVDFVDASSGAALVYGKRTSTAEFVSGETVTGTGVSFVLDADETAPPHFYTWTVYAADSATYGTIFTHGTIGCNYRGRAVISGHPYLPQMWYMSRQLNPWDFLYGANDPLSAVAGNNTNAGEVGDIVKAMIPYGDDFLVFGCASSIWILDGDPCQGGSIDMIDNSTGIYGQRAWCKDGKGNLYFYGAGGVYLMAGGRNKPENISYGQIPSLVSDWAANPSTHRVVLSYDPIREGILVTRTTLSTGTILGYWYDLKTQGWYPESYPTACGIYSSFVYESTDPSTRKLLFGSKDGYIRSFDDSAKDDDSGASDTAISSYVTLPLIQMNKDDNGEGKLISLTFELGGGASSGDFSDTDAVSYELHKGDDAETVLEDIRDGATAFSSGTFTFSTKSGRQYRVRTKVRGRWLGIKLYNSTASQTWVINLISGTILPVGRIK